MSAGRPPRSKKPLDAPILHSPDPLASSFFFAGDPTKTPSNTLQPEGRGNAPDSAGHTPHPSHPESRKPGQPRPVPNRRIADRTPNPSVPHGTVTTLASESLIHSTSSPARKTSVRFRLLLSLAPVVPFIPLLILLDVPRGGELTIALAIGTVGWLLVIMM